MLPNLLVLREPSGLQLRENLFPVDTDFETASIGRNKYKAFDPGLEFFNEFFGQTDRFWFVVSSLAVDDFDFHYFPCGAPSLMPSQAFFNCSCSGVGRRLSLSCHRSSWNSAGTIFNETSLWSRITVNLIVSPIA